MDRMRACGVCDVGSIPTEGTELKIQAFLLGFLISKTSGIEPTVHIFNERSEYKNVASRPKGEAIPYWGITAIPTNKNLLQNYPRYKLKHMEITNKKVKLTIQIWLATLFFYAAVAALITPAAWVGFFPNWTRVMVSGQILIYLFSLWQIILAIWIISGKRLFSSALAAAITLLLIIVSNVEFFDVIFRDFYLLASALLLTALSRQEEVIKK